MQAKKRVKQKRTGVTSINHAVTRYYPSSFAQVRKKDDEQQHRFLSSLRSSQHCLLPGTLFCFTFVKQRQTRTVCRKFFLAWLASFGVIGSSIVRSTPHEVKACLRSTGFRRHLSGYRLRSAGFRRHLSAPRKSAPDEVQTSSISTATRLRLSA